MGPSRNLSLDFSPTADTSTGSLVAVDANSDSLESQADSAVLKIADALDSLFKDSSILKRILDINECIVSNGESISDNEVMDRINRGVLLILAYFLDTHRSGLALIESVYPGYIDLLLYEFRSHAEGLITSATPLLISGIRINSIRECVNNSLFGVLKTCRDSFTHQKWEGAYNSRGFEHYRAQVLHAALRRKAKEGGESRPFWFSQITIDLNKFKDINDSYGSGAGDKVLRGFLDILKRTVRDIDIIGMPGGDEYLLFLPDTDQEGAVKLAARIVENFEASPLIVCDDSSREIKLDGLEGRPKVGLSVGVATIELNRVPSHLNIALILVDMGEKLSRGSEFAMEGAKVLWQSKNPNLIVTMEEAISKEHEIARLVAEKNARRSAS